MQLHRAGAAARCTYFLTSLANAAPAVVDSLNWGYVQLGLFTLAFAGLQVWWISGTLCGRQPARPIKAQEFKRSLERIWVRDQQS